MAKDNSLFTFLAGAAIGAAVAILASTDKGKEVADKLNEKAYDLGDKAKEKAADLAEQAKNKGGEFAESAREAISKGLDNLEDALKKRGETPDEEPAAEA